MLTFRKAPVWLDKQDMLAQWYSTPLGQSIASELQRRVRQNVADVFGYQALQVGNPVAGMDWLEGAGLHRRILLDAPGRHADVNGDVLQLPIASNSMKLVFFLHTLDFCDQPHQALREADRVLMDDGQLLVVGFNPWSSFGVRRLISARRQRSAAPWQARFLSRGRIGEWLSVLDYGVLHSEALFLRPPINSERLLNRLHVLESTDRLLGGLGGVYLMRARKQTVPATPVRNFFRAPGAAVGAGLARTSDAQVVPFRPSPSVVRRQRSTRNDRTRR